MSHPLAAPIPQEEYRARRARLLELPDAQEAAGFVWWANHRVFYPSGFALVPTERPAALLIRRSGEAVLFVPRLELEHAQAYASVDRVASYPEYPDTSNRCRSFSPPPLAPSALYVGVEHVSRQ